MSRSSSEGEENEMCEIIVNFIHIKDPAQLNSQLFLLLINLCV